MSQGENWARFCCETNSESLSSPKNKAYNLSPYLLIYCLNFDMRNSFQDLSTKPTIIYKLKKTFPESEEHFSHRCQNISNLKISTLLMSHSQIDAMRSWIIQG